MFDKDQAAYNRANRTQKPDFAPGMGSSDPFGGGGMNSDPFASSGSSDPFGSSGGSDPFGGGGSPDPFGSSGGSDPFGGGGGSNPFGGGGASDPFGASGNSFGGASPFGGSPDPFGGGGMMGSFAGSGFGMQPTAVEQPKAPEDKFFDALKSIGKTIGGVILDVIKSFSKNDVVFWNKYALRVAIFGAVVAGLNLLACIFGFPGLFPIIAGLLTAGLGVMCFMFTFESASGYTPPQPAIEEPQPSFDTSSSDFAFDTSMDDDSYYDEEVEDEIYESQYEDYEEELDESICTKKRFSTSVVDYVYDKYILNESVEDSPDFKAFKQGYFKSVSTEGPEGKNPYNPETESLLYNRFNDGWYEAQKDYEKFFS